MATAIALVLAFVTASITLVASPASAVAPGLPGTVTGLVGDGKIFLYWVASTGTPLDYKIEAATGAPATPTRYVGSNKTYYVFDGLTNGTNYTFTVNADKTVFRDLKLSDLLNGVHIEVKGYIQGNTVVVTQVTADPVPNAPGVKLLGLSGKISAITETTFTVNGQVITRNGNTQFVDENGKRFTEPLSVGLKVKVWMFKPATDNGSPLTALLVVVSTDS